MRAAWISLAVGCNAPHAAELSAPAAHAQLARRDPSYTTGLMDIE